MEQLFEQIERELDISFSKAGGPGGQNVNKRETKVTIHWDIKNSQIDFDTRMLFKTFFHLYHKSLITKDDVIVIQAANHRTQEQNKEEALDRLEELLIEALEPKKKRIATKPSRSSKAKQKKKQLRHKEKKQARTKVKLDDY